jgi:glutamine synthetase
MNPYFAMAAIFGLGLRGMEQKLKLPYGPIDAPDVTRDTFKREGSVAREVFGDYFVDHFAGTREHELAEHRKAVTSWEGRRHVREAIDLSCSLFRVGLKCDFDPRRMGQSY